MCHWTLNKRRLYSSSQKLVSTTSRVIIHRPHCHNYQRSKSSYPDPEAIIINLSKDKKTIAQNLESQARYAQALVIWTDCDREGEHIGNEIVEAARKGKPGIQVLRARFSNVERAYVVMSSYSTGYLLTITVMLSQQPRTLRLWMRGRSMLYLQESSWIFVLVMHSPVFSQTTYGLSEDLWRS